MKNNIDYTTKVLEVSNLKQHFKVGVGKNKLKVKAIDDISFDMYKKEVFGLVGESGCGKTTTGRTIIKLYKPTSGVIKLNGDVIGAGVNDFYGDIKRRKHNHKIELLKLNQYKYDIYLIEEKYQKLIQEYKNEVSLAKQEFEKKKQEIQKPIFVHKELLFNKKNELEKDVERLLFDYIIEKENIISLTKNRYLIEQENLIEGLKITNKRKLEGLRESAALSRELKAKHKIEIIENYNKKLEEIKAEYGPKIVEYNDQLLSKEKSKEQLEQLKHEYQSNKKAREDEYSVFVNGLGKPDFEKINSEIAVLKDELSSKVKLINEKINELRLKKAEEKKQVNSSNEIDQNKYAEIEASYNEFLSEQKEKIKQASTLNNSKKAREDIRKMQMIFQDPISSLNPRMTVQEIVSEGLVINGEKDKKIIQEKVLQVLNLVGLSPDYISRYPHEFSGGQRQRIGIARALIMNPSVIIADEPISALDVSIKAQIINLLAELKEKLDLSILFIAHDLSVVKFFCDRVAVMYFGKIVELATSEELFKHPLHGYTKALLSAIPHPDPDYEKIRERTTYSPAVHDYSEDKPEFVEIYEGHFVLANKKEIEIMKAEIGGKNEN